MLGQSSVWHFVVLRSARDQSVVGQSAVLRLVLGKSAKLQLAVLLVDKKGVINLLDN